MTCFFVTFFGLAEIGSSATMPPADQFSMSPVSGGGLHYILSYNELASAGLSFSNAIENMRQPFRLEKGTVVPAAKNLFLGMLLFVIMLLIPAYYRSARIMTRWTMLADGKK